MLTSHMIHLKMENGFWDNIENCHIAALKYFTKTDFKKKSSSAYDSSCKNGWLNDICSHMIKKESKL